MTLKALRANKNWIQTQVAHALWISLETWKNYERYVTYPDVIMIGKIEKVFGVKYDDIIFCHKLRNNRNFDIELTPNKYQLRTRRWETMIANGWKTADEIQNDYQIKRSTWQRLKAACLESNFDDAIVLAGGKTYVIEDRWQDFLVYLSRKKKEERGGAKTARRMKVAK